MVLRAEGETRGRAPKERGKADNEREDRSGGDSLGVGTGTLRDSVGGMIVSLDVSDTSLGEEGVGEEDEEAEGGLLLLLDASVLPWG